MLMFCMAIISHTKPCRCGRLFRRQEVIFDMIIPRWASLTDWQILCIFQIDCLQCQHWMFTYSITFQLAHVALGRWGGGITKFRGRETDLPSDPSLKKIQQNIDDWLSHVLWPCVNTSLGQPSSTFINVKVYILHIHNRERKCLKNYKYNELLCFIDFSI